MTEEMDRNLRKAFAPQEGVEGRVARAALDPRPGSRRRVALAAGLAVAGLVTAGTLTLLSRDDSSTAVLTMTNEGSVVAVTLASGDIQLTADSSIGRGITIGTGDQP